MPTGSRQPPEQVPVSRLGKLSGAHAAGRTQFRPSPLLQSTHRFGEPFPVTRPRAGASVWATSFPRRGFPVKARPLTSPESPVQSQSLVSRGGQQAQETIAGITDAPWSREGVLGRPSFRPFSFEGALRSRRVAEPGRSRSGVWRRPLLLGPVFLEFGKNCFRMTAAAISQ